MTARQIYLDLLNSQDDDEVHVSHLGLRSADLGLYSKLCREYPEAIEWTHEGGAFTLFIQLPGANNLCVTFPAELRKQVAS